MKKYKTGHYETLKAGLFPRMFPQGKNGWVNKKWQSRRRVTTKNPFKY